MNTGKSIVRLVIICSTLGLLVGCSGESPEGQQRQAKEAFDEGHYQEARELYMRALHNSPSDRDLLYYAGLCYRRLSQYDSALVLFKRADILHRHDMEINIQLYEVAMTIGDWEAAIGAILQLIGKDESEAYYEQLLTELYDRIDHPSETVYWGRRMLENDPADLDMYLTVVRNALRLDSTAFALEVIDKARSRFGDRDVLLANRALVLANSERYDEAEAILRKLIGRDSTRADLLYNLAGILAAQNDSAKRREALKIYERLRDIHPQPHLIDSLIRELQTAPPDRQ